MTLGEWLVMAERQLREAGVESPRLDAQLLAAHGLGQTRSWVLAHGEDPLVRGLVDPFLDRRLAREPLAYIVGSREFYGRSFTVSPSVLIPRQETESLVEMALRLARPGDQVVDIGTGTGCIAITLALEKPALAVTGVDLSPNALRVAMNNAITLGAAVEFLPGDLFAPVAGRAFDWVVSNPPYIAPDVTLMPEVQGHEPGMALFADEGGLAIYRRLATEGRNLTGGMIVEAGDGMADQVREVFAQCGWQEEGCERDLDGWERALAFSPLI